MTARAPGVAVALWLARYAAVLLVGFVALERVDTGPLCALLARVTHGVLALGGSDATRAGAAIDSTAFSMQVVRACDGTDICLILGAAILTTAAPWRRRLTGMTLALVLTQALNVGRLVVLFVVGSASPDMFEAAHQLLWQVGMMVWAVLFYVRWL